MQIPVISQYNTPIGLDGHSAWTTSQATADGLLEDRHPKTSKSGGSRCVGTASTVQRFSPGPLLELPIRLGVLFGT